MKPHQACLILSCKEHLEFLLQILDEVGVTIWTVISACQSRRLGFLQYVPGRHPAHSYLVVGMAPAEAIEHLQRCIEDARHQGRLCAECLAYTWALQPLSPPQVALDPICEEVVSCDSAPSVSYEGQTYHFSSEKNRDLFLQSPQRYVEDLHLRRIGRRNLEASPLHKVA